MSKTQPYALARIDPLSKGHDAVLRKLLRNVARDFPIGKAWCGQMALEMVLAYEQVDGAGARQIIEEFAQHGAQTFSACV